MPPLRVFFLLAFGITWGVGLIGLIAGRLAVSSPLYLLAGYSVSLTGVVLTLVYDGFGGLQRLGQRLAPWRSGAQWYVLVLAGYAAITAIATGVSHAPLVFHGFAAMVRDPGPLGEELGWRGFALPRLLQRYSPLQATMILGLAHAIWHAPLFFIPGMPQKRLFFPIFTLGVIAIAVFDTALYLRTRASLLLAILVHLLANVGGGMINASAFPAFALAEAAAAVAVLLAGGLIKPRAT